MREKIILFGASTLGQAALKILKNKYDIIFFCDNDDSKWNNYCNDVKIISPHELVYFKDIEIIITSSDSKEISKQLEDMDIYNFRIFSYNLFRNDTFLNNNQSLINKFVSNNDFPFLISFPRTGSHWLRMLMELYFEKPSLVRTFFYKNAKDFTCFHTHDLNLEVERKNVIYLYRNPTETIYSQMRYHQENLHDIKRISFWSELYGKHLSKWLLREEFSEKKTIVTYEGMQKGLDKEFIKVCKHLGDEFNFNKFSKTKEMVNKENLKNKTKSYDNQVVNLSDEYDLKREEFSNLYTDNIINNIIKLDKNLEKFI